MKPMTLNLKSMKKVAGDDKSSTFEHEDGHKIMVAHSGLSPLQRKQIAKLPVHKKDGGTTEDTGDAGVQTLDFNALPDAPPPQAQPAMPVDPGVAAQQWAQGSRPGDVPTTLFPSGSMNNAAVQQSGQFANRLTEDTDILQAQRQANAQNEILRQQKALVDNRNARAAEMQKHVQEYDNYVKDNPIDARHFFKTQNGGQKAATAISLLLGGLGGGRPGSGPNPAAKFLDQMVATDVQAQRDNAQNKKNIWGAYKELYDSNVAADNLTAAQLKQYQLYQTEQIANKLGTPRAKAAAAMRAAQLTPEINAHILNAAGDINQIQGGGGGAGAQQPQSPQSQPQSPQGDYYDTHVLKPGAVEASRSMGNVKYLDKGDLNTQLAAADQADKVLSNLPQIYQNLNAETNGMSGRLSRTFNPHAAAAVGTGIGALVGSALPGVGTAVGAGVGGTGGEIAGQVGSAALNTTANREYAHDQNRLEMEIRTALPHVGAEEIHRAVANSSPETGDSPELLKKKMEDLKTFLKQNVKTTELEKAGLVPSRKR